MGLQGLYSGLMGGIQLQQQQHAALVQQAIQQAQQKHQDDELAQQKLSEDHRYQNQIGDNMVALQGHADNLLANGWSGAQIAKAYEPFLPTFSTSGNDWIPKYLENLRSMGQSPQYLQDQAAAKAKGDTADAQFKQKAAENIAATQQKLYETFLAGGIGRNQAWNQAKQDAAALHPDQSAAPEDHNQLVSDAIQKASGVAPGQSGVSSPQTMQMPSGASAPSLSAMWQQMQGQQPSPVSQVVPPQQQLPVNGGTAPPASTLPGAGVPQSMVNPTAAITGEGGQGQAPQAQMPPQGLPPAQQPSTPVSRAVPLITPEGFSGVLPAVASKLAAANQRMELQAQTVQNKKQTYEQNAAFFGPKLANIIQKHDVDASSIALHNAQIDALNQMTPARLQYMQQQGLHIIKQDELAGLKYQADQDQRSFNNAVKTGQISTPGMQSQVNNNASNYAKSLLSMQKEQEQIKLARASALATLDKKITPTPPGDTESNPADWQKYNTAVSNAHNLLTPVYDPQTGESVKSPLDVRVDQLNDGINQIKELQRQNAGFQMQANNTRATSNSGKPQGLGQRYSGQVQVAPVTGVKPMKFPTNQAIPPAGQKLIKAGGGKVDYKSMSTADLLKRLGQKVK